MSNSSLNRVSLLPKISIICIRVSLETFFLEYLSSNPLCQHILGCLLPLEEFTYDRQRAYSGECMYKSAWNTIISVFFRLLQTCNEPSHHWHTAYRSLWLHYIACRNLLIDAFKNDTRLEADVNSFLQNRDIFRADWMSYEHLLQQCHT